MNDFGDLIKSLQEKPNRVFSMVGGHKPDFERDKKEYEEEMAMLERGGSDSKGEAAWNAAMRRLGRR